MMKNGKLLNNKNSGFSLVIIAVLIALFGYLLISASKPQVEVQKTNFITTKQKIDKITQALSSYKTANGSYPCPADPEVLSSNSDFGVMEASCSCPTPGNNLTCGGSTIYGMPPTRSLGLPDSFGFDEWGNRITYAYNSAAGITITDSAGSTLTEDITTMVLSHGKDGIGAYDIGGKPWGASRGTNTKPVCSKGSYSTTLSEIQNCDRTDGVFHSRGWDMSSSTNYYDDVMNYNIRTGTCEDEIDYPEQSYLVSWYDATDIAGTGVSPANNSTVTTWVDKKSGRNLTKTSTGPTFKTSGINSKAAVEFDATTDVMETSALDWGGQYTIFAAYVPNNISTHNYLLETQGSSHMTLVSSIGFGWFRGNTNINQAYSRTAPVIKTGEPYILTGRYEKESNSSKVSTLYINGQKQYETTYTGANNTACTSGGQSPSTCKLTLSSTNATYFLRGAVGEILYYNTPLSASCREVVECKLAKKWGVTVRSDCQKDDGTSYTELNNSDTATNKITDPDDDPGTNNWPICSSAEHSITNITNANPAVVTYSDADNYSNGDIISIQSVLGMTEINDTNFTVANVNTAANTFELSGIDSTSYGTYTSGGTITDSACPAGIAGCSLWYNFQDNATVLDATGNAAADNEVIAMVCDKSGNGRDAIKVTSPTYDTDAFGAGKAGFNMNGGFFNIERIPNLDNGFTATVSFRTAASIPNYTYPFIADSSYGFNVAAYTDYLTADVYNSNTAYSRTPNYTIKTNNNYVITLSYSGNTTKQARMFINGAEAVKGDQGTVGIFNYFGLALGARTTGANMYISEYVVYSNGELSDTDRKAVENDVGNRAGVTMPHTDFPSCPAAVGCPAGLTGCDYWYDAQVAASFRDSSDSTVSVDGTAINTWCDISGNNNHATSIGSPVLKTDAFGTGKNGFNLLNGHFLNSRVSDSLENGFTYFTVFRTSVSSIPHYTYPLLSGVSYGYALYLYQSYFYPDVYNINSAYVKTQPNLIQQNKNYLLTLSYSGSSTKIVKAFVNGVQIVQSSAGTAAMRNNWGALLGASYTPSNSYIGEELMFGGSELSAADRKAVEDELGDKWGIPMSHSDTTCPASSSCPAGVTGCAFWYNAQDGSTLFKSASASSPSTTPVSNGETVQTWCDKSSNANHATAIGSPTLTTNIYGTGKDGINIYNGFFVNNHTSGLENGFTAFASLRTASTNLPHYTYLLDSSGGYSYSLYAYQRIFYPDTYNVHTNYTKSPDYTISANSNYIVSMSYSGTSTKLVKFYINGNLVAQGPAGTASLLNNLGALMGTYTVGYPSNTYLGEIAMFSGGALSDVNRKAVENEMGDRWGVAMAHSDTTCPASSSCPAGLSGCRYWYDGLDGASFFESSDPSSASTAVNSDGDTIVTWCDKSGNNNHAVATGTPTYKVDAFGTGLNGFNFSNGGLISSYDSNLSSNGYTFHTVYRSTVVNPSLAFPMMSNTYDSYIRSHSTGLMGYKYNGSGSAASYTANKTFVLSLTTSGTSPYTTSLYINGSLAGTSFSTLQIGNYSGYYHGLLGGTANTYYIGEASLFNPQQSAGNLTSTICATAERWSSCGNLPSSYCSSSTNPSDLQGDDFCCGTTAADACAAVCGDSVISGGETCDDGNTNSCDGCDASCQTEAAATCGNGVQECGETCDDSNTTDNDGCSDTCQDEYCGDSDINDNGIEQCDDGNNTSCDGCDSSCQTEAASTCGNGMQECGETCDDSNTTDNDGCSDTCQDEYCGDNEVNDNGAEACDDGNTSSGDGCDSSCQTESCGTYGSDPGWCSGFGFSWDCNNGCYGPSNGTYYTDYSTFCSSYLYNYVNSSYYWDGDSCEISGGMWCGDGSCNNGEDCNSCSSDCSCAGQCNYSGTNYNCESCGNASCESGESYNNNCPSDCGGGGWCGDASCNNGEDCNSCSTDCGSCGYCGDWSCNGSDTTANCPQDCGSSCGDGSCNTSGYGSYEDCSNCSSDCGSCASCGNGVTEGGETCDDWNTSSGDGCDSSCQTETASCGNSNCEGWGGENCSTCDTDCGACDPCSGYCGSGTYCNAGICECDTGNGYTEGPFDYNAGYKNCCSIGYTGDGNGGCTGV